MTDRNYWEYFLENSIFCLRTLRNIMCAPCLHLFYKYVHFRDHNIQLLECPIEGCPSASKVGLAASVIFMSFLSFFFVRCYIFMAQVDPLNVQDEEER